MAQYEDPKEQLFHDALEAQLTLGTNEKINPKTRRLVLHDLQEAIIVHKHSEDHAQMTGKLSRTLDKAVDQAKRLRDGEE